MDKTKHYNEDESMKSVDTSTRIDTIFRYGCDQSYNEPSGRGQHEKRVHGVVGPREAELGDLGKKLKNKNEPLPLLGSKSLQHPATSFLP